MAWLFKQIESDNWWIGYRFNGRQYRRTTGTSDRDKAERELAKLNSIYHANRAGSLTEEFFRLLTQRPGVQITLLKALDDWLHDCRNLDEGTLERYRNVRKSFVEYTKADDHGPLLRDISRETIAGFLRHKRGETSVATTKLYRRVLAGFYTYAADNDLVQSKPIPSVKSLKLIQADSNGERRCFTLDELKTIYGFAPDDFWRYMIIMGFYCAQRMGDLITLVWGGADFESNMIRLLADKQNRTVKVPMHPTVRNMLLALRDKAGAVKPSDPIWPEQAAKYEAQGAGPFSNQFYDEMLLPAGLVPKRTHHAKKDRTGRARQMNSVSFHCLRHTFVSLLKISGASQAVAKELAGHASDAVSDLYTHVPEAALTKAIAKLPEVTK